MTHPEVTQRNSSRLSRFVVTYRDVAAGEHVLYDVLGDRYVGVDASMLEAITRWKDQPPAVDSEREAATALGEMGFLVVDRAADEARLASHWARSAEGVPGTLSVTWLPTLACNMACTYCFQREHPTAGSMTAETEAATRDFILRSLDAAPLRHLVVNYIGGEPLLRQDLLLRSASELSAALRARGGSFAWELTTNGLGLTPELVNTLLSHGKGTVKLTLDGDAETHDAARVRRGGRGTFDEVFDAAARVARECPGLQLRIGGNFRAGQAGSYARLLERLEAAGLRGLVDQVRFKPVVDTSLGACGGGCSAVQAEADTLVQINRAIEARGLGRRPLGAIDSAGLCELHWKNAWVVDPEGRLYRCLEVAGRPELAIGTVFAGATRPDPLTQDRPWERHGACGDCAFLPVCGGGCLGGRYLQTGRTGEVLCRLEQFQTSFREEVASRYLAEFHAEEKPEAA